MNLMPRRLVVQYNGELYQFRELRDELLSRGHIFRSGGNTEMVLRSYEEGIANCFSRFEGMFAHAPTGHGHS